MLLFKWILKPFPHSLPFIRSASCMSTQWLRTNHPSRWRNFVVHQVKWQLSGFTFTFTCLLFFQKKTPYAVHSTRFPQTSPRKQTHAGVWTSLQWGDDSNSGAAPFSVLSLYLPAVNKRERESDEDQQILFTKSGKTSPSCITRARRTIFCHGCQWRHCVSVQTDWLTGGSLPRKQPSKYFTTASRV